MPFVAAVISGCKECCPKTAVTCCTVVRFRTIFPVLLCAPQTRYFCNARFFLVAHERSMACSGETWCQDVAVWDSVSTSLLDPSASLSDGAYLLLAAKPLRLPRRNSFIFFSSAQETGGCGDVGTFTVNKGSIFRHL